MFGKHDCDNFSMQMLNSNKEDKSLSAVSAVMIDPPIEFQDKPDLVLYKNIADKLIPKIITEGIRIYCKTVLKCMEFSPLKSPVQFSDHQVPTSSYWTSDFLPFGSPPSSSRSLVSSRLSSSHNSLTVPATHKVDDSSFIMQAVSHDILVNSQITDVYNVPFDSDIYAVPVDVIRQPLKAKRTLPPKKKRRNTSCCHELNDHFKNARKSNLNRKCFINYVQCNCVVNNSKTNAKRHSVAGSSADVEGEPVHMTLQQVRQYLQTLYSSSSDSSIHVDKDMNKKNTLLITNNNKYLAENKIVLSSNTKNSRYNLHISSKSKKNEFLINNKDKHVSDNCDTVIKEQGPVTKSSKIKKSAARISSLKQTICNIFRFRRFVSPDRKRKSAEVSYRDNIVMVNSENHKLITNRALPPLPSKTQCSVEQAVDFTTSIQKVKDYGWYWGPISSETAEKVLSNEPDGSFIVRDSSDDHYIFSLTFKLNNSIRHVRIEHDQGNFSFGSCTKFKSQTIVEFIENAVEHSRSGRYLFFLHRRPVIGPVRVQLLHPVSRFKQVQSLQHMCRFVILKLVRRDLLSNLPLPRRMIDYLNTPHYYSEHLSEVVEEQEENNTNVNNTVPLFNNAVVAVNNNFITSISMNNILVSNTDLTSHVFANNVRGS